MNYNACVERCREEKKKRAREIAQDNKKRIIGIHEQCEKLFGLKTIY